MSALDDFLQHKRPNNFLCECLSIQEHPHCNCGHDEAAAELARLRAARDEARKVIEPFAIKYGSDGLIYFPRHNITFDQCQAASAWLEKYS